MEYNNTIKAIFKSRPNRFLADVIIENEIHQVHIKNTGRLKELLIEGCTVYLTKSDSTNRKTAYDLVCVEKQTSKDNTVLFNIDSQVANTITEEWLNKRILFNDAISIKHEVKYNNSRFDFFIKTENEKFFLEVKGVTLDNNGIALFPDAPTQRGIKHINELIDATKNGYGAYILFVLQYKGAYKFMPNTQTHADFATALKNAQNAGVNILAVDCEVTPSIISIDSFVEVNI